MSHPRPSDLERTGAARAMQAVLGILNLSILGMLLHLRLGPFTRIMRRMADRGVPVPDWIPLVFNAGVAVVGVYLAWRGLGHLRSALRPGPRRGAF